MNGLVVNVITPVSNQSSVDVERKQIVDLRAGRLFLHPLNPTIVCVVTDNENGQLEGKKAVTLNTHTTVLISDETWVTPVSGTLTVSKNYTSVITMDRHGSHGECAGYMEPPDTLRGESL